MSSSFVTQCPECRTRFRVNHAQLGAANGAVRCGACMHVFNAARHLVADQPVMRTAPASENPHRTAPVLPATADLKPQAAASIQGTPPGKASSDTLWIHDDLDLDDIDLDEELARLEREEMQISKDFLNLEQAPKPAEALLAAPPASDPHDERWAEALLNENSSTQEAMPAPAAAVPAQPGADDQPDAGNQALPPTASEPGGLESESEPEPDSAVEPAQQPEQLQRAPANRGRRRSDAAVTAADNLELTDEPLQLDWRPPARPRGRIALWGLLNLLALGLLAGQFVFHNFDDLARQDQYRPWFAQVCPLLGCRLPSKVDIQQIKSSNLMVRAHPEFAGALIVDAIIYNRAPFAQPFPLLEMRFADLQGQPVASRRFNPAEYLAGELAGKTEMPSQTPIRIALEILDPGRHAENYSLSFLSPE